MELSEKYHPSFYYEIKNIANLRKINPNLRKIKANEAKFKVNFAVKNIV
jgi:hypothetical protein